MKTVLSALGLALSVAIGGVSNAQSINFAQFGPDGTTLSSPISGLTTNGVGVSLTSPGGSFSIYQQSLDWGGGFPSGAAVLYDSPYGGPNGTFGPVTLSFASGISSMTLAAESETYGPYFETALAYSGTTLVDAVSLFATSAYNPGTIPFMTVKGTDITSVVIETTNDHTGIGIVGLPVPEPSTYALMLAGLGLVAVVTRRRRALK